MCLYEMKVSLYSLSIVIYGSCVTFLFVYVLEMTVPIESDYYFLRLNGDLRLLFHYTSDCSIFTVSELYMMVQLGCQIETVSFLSLNTPIIHIQKSVIAHQDFQKLCFSLVVQGMGAVYPQCCGSDPAEAEVNTEHRAELTKLQKKLDRLQSDHERVLTESDARFSKLSIDYEQKAKLLAQYNEEKLKSEGLLKAQYESELLEYKSKSITLQQQLTELMEAMQLEQTEDSEQNEYKTLSSTLQQRNVELNVKIKELERERDRIKSTADSLENENLKLNALIDEMKDHNEGGDSPGAIVITPDLGVISDSQALGLQPEVLYVD